MCEWVGGSGIVHLFFYGFEWICFRHGFHGARLLSIYPCPSVQYVPESIGKDDCSLVNHLKSRIRNQCLRYADAFRCLVVLQQCGDDARQGKCGAVQRVAKFGLLVLRAVAAFQTVCLIGVEVGDGA